MPVTKQAQRRMRSDMRKRDRNQPVLSKLKTLKKKCSQTSTPEDTQKSVRTVSQVADKAASKGIIPKKRANRIKSRAAKRIHKVKNEA